MPTGHGKRSGVRRNGSVLVESALVLPIVMMFFFGIMEYGRWLMTAHLYNNAVCAGANYASKHSSAITLAGTTYGAATSDVTAVVNSTLGTTQLTNQTVNVFLSDSIGTNTGSWLGAQNGQYICVQITGTYTFAIFKWLGLNSSYSVSFQAVRRSEGN